MFRCILLPVDLTEKNAATIELARQLLDPSGGTLVLLHVIETIADAPFEDLEDFYRRLEEKARRGMASLAEPLEEQGMTVEQRVVYGKRAPEIVSFAEQRQADLVALGSHPLDPQNPGGIWGSISHQVAILARCPVLLVK